MSQAVPVPNINSIGTSSNATNYDVIGGTSPLVTNRAANTFRYVGATAAQNFIAVLTLNGLMNSGTGQLTFAPGSSGGRVAIGANSTNELDLAAAAYAAQFIDIPIQNGITAGSIVVLGSSIVILNGANTYTGDTTIAGGTLQLWQRGY